MAPARITRTQRVAFSAISWPKSSRRPIASSAATSARSRSRRSRRACRSKAGSCCVGHQPAFDKLTDEQLTLVATRLRDTVRRLHAALAAPPHTVLLHSGKGGQEPVVRLAPRNRPAAVAAPRPRVGRRPAHQPSVARGGGRGAALTRGWLGRLTCLEGLRCLDCLRCQECA